MHIPGREDHLKLLFWLQCFPWWRCTVTDDIVTLCRESVTPLILSLPTKYSCLRSLCISPRAASMLMASYILLCTVLVCTDWSGRVGSISLRTFSMIYWIRHTFFCVVVCTFCMMLNILVPQMVSAFLSFLFLDLLSDPPVWWVYYSFFFVGIDFQIALGL